MNGTDDSSSLLHERMQMPHQNKGGGAVKARSRLVQEQEHRIRQQLQSDADALSLASTDATLETRKSDSSVCTFFNIETRDHLLHPVSLFFPTHCSRKAQTRTVSQQLAGSQVSQQSVVLHHISADVFENTVLHLVSVYPHLPGLASSSHSVRQQIQEGTFPRSCKKKPKLTTLNRG